MSNFAIAAGRADAQELAAAHDLTVSEAAWPGFDLFDGEDGDARCVASAFLNGIDRDGSAWWGKTPLFSDRTHRTAHDCLLGQLVDALELCVCCYGSRHDSLHRELCVDCCEPTGGWRPDRCLPCWQYETLDESERRPR